MLIYIFTHPLAESTDITPQDSIKQLPSLIYAKMKLSGETITKRLTEKKTDHLEKSFRDWPGIVFAYREILRRCYTVVKAHAESKVQHFVFFFRFYFLLS